MKKIIALVLAIMMICGASYADMWLSSLEFRLNSKFDAKAEGICVPVSIAAYRALKDQQYQEVEMIGIKRFNRPGHRIVTFRDRFGGFYMVTTPIRPGENLIKIYEVKGGNKIKACDAVFTDWYGYAKYDGNNNEIGFYNRIRI